MSKTRKSDLVKRRKRLNQKQNKLEETGLRIDDSHESGNTDVYQLNVMKLLRSELSPRRMEMLLEDAIKRQDSQVIRFAAQGMMDRQLADPELYAISGIAALQCSHAHLAHRDLTRAVQSGADGDMVAQAKDALPKIEGVLSQHQYPARLHELFSAEELYEASYENDRVQELMYYGQLKHAHRHAEVALRRFSSFLPLQNNLVMTAIALGDYEKAKRHASEVIAIHSDDVIAIANIAMLEWLHGDLESCKRRLQSVATIPESRREGLNALIEVAFKANQPQLAIDLWERNQDLQDKVEPHYFARDAKLMAWAYQRVGASDQGLAVLERCEGKSRDETVYEMREDLQQRSELQIGVTPLPLGYWLAEHTVELLHESTSQNSRDALQRLKKQLLDRYPALVGAILDRGPLSGKELILRLCYQCKTLTDPILDAVASFASGRWGETADRMLARKLCQIHGRTVDRLWVGGDWFPENLLTLDLHVESEKPPRRSKELNDLLVEAMECGRNGYFAKAEKLYRKAISEDQDARDIRHNLISMVAGQGRRDEARQLILDLHHDHPDYFFAQIQWANLLFEDAKLDEVETLLNTILLDRTRWHVNEADAYGQIAAELADKRGNQPLKDQFQRWSVGCKAFEPMLRDYQPEKVL